MRVEHPLETFYRDNHVRFFRYAMRLTRHEQQAADVVQEALARCLPRFLGTDPETAISADRWVGYLFRAIHNQAVNVGLRSREQATDPRLLPADPGPDVAEVSGAADTVQWCLDQLTPSERSIYLLAVDGFRQREVGELLGVSPDVVYRRIRSAETKLRRCLERVEDDG